MGFVKVVKMQVKRMPCKCFSIYHPQSQEAVLARLLVKFMYYILSLVLLSSTSPVCGLNAPFRFNISLKNVKKVGEKRWFIYQKVGGLFGM